MTIRPDIGGCKARNPNWEFRLTEVCAVISTTSILIPAGLIDLIAFKIFSDK
jgi:hypothetical protein